VRISTRHESTSPRDSARNAAGIASKPTTTKENAVEHRATLRRAGHAEIRSAYCVWPSISGKREARHSPHPGKSFPGRKYGTAAVESLRCGPGDRVPEYRFVAPLSRAPPQTTLRQVDPLIRNSPSTATSSIQTQEQPEYLIELNRALRQHAPRWHRAVLETRLHQRKRNRWRLSISFPVWCRMNSLVAANDCSNDEETSTVRDPQKALDNFDFNFNKKMNRSLVFDLATATFVARHEDALFLGPPGTGKSTWRSHRTRGHRAGLSRDLP